MTHVDTEMTLDSFLLGRRRGKGVKGGDNECPPLLSIASA